MLNSFGRPLDLLLLNSWKPQLPSAEPQQLSPLPPSCEHVADPVRDETLTPWSSSVKPVRLLNGRKQRRRQLYFFLQISARGE